MGLPTSAALLLILVASSTAQAQPAGAKEHYQEGLSHYNLSEWRPALEEFREAYRLKADPAFLYNIAQCYRQLGEYRQAANHYRAFRRERGTSEADPKLDALILQMDRQAEASQARANAPSGQPAAATSAPVAATTTAAVTARPSRPPLTKRPWFWAAVGGGAIVVAAAVTLGVVFGTPAKNPSLAFGAVQGN